MKDQFRQAYRAFRLLGNAPDWRAFDASLRGVGLNAAIAAGVVFCSRWRA